MTIRLEGRARVLGNDINTDYIIASTRKRETLDEQILKRYLLETIDPTFAASVVPGDVLVAGRNFGCGSAMEVAATVILAAGIRAVLARSFARTFFRNAINNGLPAVECDTTAIVEGDQLGLELSEGRVEAAIPLRGLRLPGAPLTPIMLAILQTGGVVPYLRQHGAFTSS